MHRYVINFSDFQWDFLTYLSAESGNSVASIVKFLISEHPRHRTYYEHLIKSQVKASTDPEPSQPVGTNADEQEDIISQLKNSVYGRMPAKQLVDAFVKEIAACVDNNILNRIEYIYDTLKWHNKLNKEQQLLVVHAINEQRKHTNDYAKDLAYDDPRRPQMGETRVEYRARLAAGGLVEPLFDNDWQ